MTQSQSPVTLKATRKRGEAITGHAHFAMVELQALEGLGDLIARAPKAAQLVTALIRRMQPGSAGVVVCSRETMRELLGASMPTVDRALRLLMEEGWVQRIRIGGAYALAINRRVAWIGSRGQLQHAVFDATVIASRSEQDALGLEPPPMRSLPMMHPDEMPIATGRGLEPPSQPGLDGINHPIALTGDAADRAELEQLGQQRLIEGDQQND